jgi:hypothetical protein
MSRADDDYIKVLLFEQHCIIIALMGAPVFKHTVARISEAIGDEKVGLRSILSLMKYDPELFFSYIQGCSSRQGYEDVTTLCQAGPMLGLDAIRRVITVHPLQLDDPDSLMLWHMIALAGEAGVRINQMASIANDDEAFFSAVIPFAGMTMMISDRPQYKRLIPLLVKLSIGDRVYLENSLFGVDHISILTKAPKMPQIYRDVLRFIMQERFPVSMRTGEGASRLSEAYEALQLYRLSLSAQFMAQSILFPFIVLAEENFKGLNKRFFNIPENRSEGLLTDILENYEAVCKDFGQAEAAYALIREAMRYKTPEIKFLTASIHLQETLDRLFEGLPQERNLVILGEPGAGKRLLAQALKAHPLNPRRTKPFLSFHCDTLERETLEEELLGAKGGYLGKEQRKGAFDIAAGGVIMLKDINTMPLPLQERLAEIISHMERGAAGKGADVRFVVTSRADLGDESRLGRFSGALLRALNPVYVTIPPLRERREDIGFIAEGIIKKYKLPLERPEIIEKLKRLYQKEAFEENLSGLKRLLFHTAAKELLEP